MGDDKRHFFVPPASAYCMWLITASSGRLICHEEKKENSQPVQKMGALVTIILYYVPFDCDVWILIKNKTNKS